MKFKHGIRRRVFSYFATFTVFLTLVYIALGVVIAYSIEDEILAKLVKLKAMDVEASYAQTQQLPLLQPPYKIYTDYSLAPKEISELYSNNIYAREVFTDDNTHYNVHLLNISNQTFKNLSFKNQPILVAEVSKLLVVQDKLKEISFLFISVFLITLLIAIAFVFRLSTSTTKPLVELARSISLSKQDKNCTTKDEVEYLRHVINDTIAQLNKTLKREADFNRDISHELRTPLTIMSNIVAMQNTSPQAKLDLTLLNDSVEYMQRTIDVLLTLAHNQSQQTESLSIRALLEECVIRLYNKIESHNFELTISVANDEVKGSTQLLSLAITNLIENAISHASTPVLSIKTKDNELIFENTYSETLPKNPEFDGVKRQESQGFGQGLFLVKRILEALDLPYTIEADKQFYRFSFALLSVSKESSSNESV